MNSAPLVVVGSQADRDIAASSVGVSAGSDSLLLGRAVSNAVVSHRRLAALAIDPEWSTVKMAGLADAPCWGMPYGAAR